MKWKVVTAVVGIMILVTVVALGEVYQLRSASETACESKDLSLGCCIKAVEELHGKPINNTCVIIIKEAGFDPETGCTIKTATACLPETIRFV